MVAQPVDQREGAIGPGGVDQPAGRFIDDEEGRMIEDDARVHVMSFGDMSGASKGREPDLKLKIRFNGYRIWNTGYGSHEEPMDQ